MGVTIKKIAEISGVSRGTVDRVLNNRGKVKPETEAQVRRVAEQLGYAPNLAAKALAAKKKSYSIGVLLSSEGVPFFDDILKGIKQAQKEYADFGLNILYRSMKGYDPARQLELLREMRGSASAVILNPISDPMIAAEINRMTDEGICVIPVNNDIENCRRFCYVGCNYFKGGEAACGMMGLITGGRANIGILTGSIKMLGHNQRIEGFRSVLKRKYPGMIPVDFGETNDDDIQAYETALQMLEAHPEINALYVVAAGTYGVCRAVLSSGREGRISIVCFDSIPSTADMMRRGLIQATICQQPFTQGYQSVRIAFDYLVSGSRPEGTQYILKNEIKILENL